VIQPAYCLAIRLSCAVVLCEGCWISTPPNTSAIGLDSVKLDKLAGRGVPRRADIETDHHKLPRWVAFEVLTGARWHHPCLGHQIQLKDIHHQDSGADGPIAEAVGDPGGGEVCHGPLAVLRRLEEHPHVSGVLRAEDNVRRQGTHVVRAGERALLVVRQAPPNVSGNGCRVNQNVLPETRTGGPNRVLQNHVCVWPHHLRGDVERGSVMRVDGPHDNDAGVQRSWDEVIPMDGHPQLNQTSPQSVRHEEHIQGDRAEPGELNLTEVAF